MAVASRSVVATVEADAAALPPRQLVQLHVEAAPPGVEVTVAGCRGKETARRVVDTQLLKCNSRSQVCVNYLLNKACDEQCRGLFLI